MNFKPIKRTPALLAVAVLLLVCALRLLRLDFFERLEWMTYDLRMRDRPAFSRAGRNQSRLCCHRGLQHHSRAKWQLGFRFGLYWPRQVYGRLVEELSAEGAKAVAFDVQFGELRPDHPPVQMADGSLVESDDFFALQLRRAGNVILAATPDAVPPDLFATNALALGDITTEKDSDGVLRRVKAFRDYRHWHPLSKRPRAEFGLDLANAISRPAKSFCRKSERQTSVEVPVDAENNFDLTDFVGDKLPPGMPPKAKAFTDERVWQMGIVLAAQELKLDLTHAEVDLPDGKIILRGANGVEASFPWIADGYFYIDWRLKPNDPHLCRRRLKACSGRIKSGLLGETNGLSDAFRGKLVVVGSAAQGNDLTDRGATPLESDTLLVSKHWNVANSVITGQFIRRASLPAELALIILLGALTAF